jgi:A/G-specific adenine glycosylase
VCRAASRAAVAPVVPAAAAHPVSRARPDAALAADRTRITFSSGGHAPQTQVDREALNTTSGGALPDARGARGRAGRDAVKTCTLGYNIRPRRLHASREAVTRYGGRLPEDEATLRSFKGIGAYTAGAVMSFAFGKRAAILDTNVARVLFRVFVGEGNPRGHAMDKELWAISRTVLPHRHVFDFNQALMDFGATLCSARKPHCLICPMTSKCRTFPFNPEKERTDRSSTRNGPQSLWRSDCGRRRDHRAPRAAVARRLKARIRRTVEFPEANAHRMNHTRCLARSCSEELGVESIVGDEIVVTDHVLRSVMRRISAGAKLSANRARCSTRNCVGSRRPSCRRSICRKATGRSLRS